MSDHQHGFYAGDIGYLEDFYVSDGVLPLDANDVGEGTVPGASLISYIGPRYLIHREEWCQQPLPCRLLFDDRRLVWCLHTCL